MTQAVQYGGQTYQFPDDASDKEILDFLGALPHDKYDADLNSVDLNATPGPSGQEELRNPDTSLSGRLMSGAAQVYGGATGELANIFGTGGGNQGMVGGKGGAVPRAEPPLPEGDYGTGASRFGKNLVDNALLEAGTVGVGGALGLAGKELAPGILPKTQEAIRGFVRSYKEAPAAHIGQTVAGTAGQQIGDAQEVQGDIPGGKGMAGYMVGAPLGAKAGQLAGSVAKGTLKAGQMAGEAVGLLPKRPRNYSVITANPDALAPVQAAASRVDGKIAQYQQRAQDIVEKFAPYAPKKPGQAPSLLTPDRADAAFEKSRTALEASMRAMETQLWGDAVKGRIQIAPAQSDIRKLVQGLHVSDPEATIPDDITNEILGWKAGIVSPKKVQGMITNIGEIRAKLRVGDPNFRGDWKRLSANLGQVQDILQTALETGVTDPAKLAEARAFTQARKGIFTDGPMGVAKYKTGRGTTSFTIPGDKNPTSIDYSAKPQADILLNQRGGFEQVAAAQKMANATGTPSTIAQDFDNTIRADFADFVQSKTKVNPGGPQGLGQVDPKLAEQYWRKNRGKIAANKKLAGDLEHAVNSIQVAGNMMDQVRNSAYARLATGNLEDTVRRMFSATDPIRDAKAITRTFDNDRFAREAWQRGVITEVLNRGNGNPQAVMDYLNSNQPVKNMLSQVFKQNPEQLDNFYRLLPAMAAYEKSLNSGARGAVKGGVRMIAGIWGAGAGRLLGTGTVQVPGVVAKGFRGFAERTMNTIMPDAYKTMSYALIDPKVSKWLLSKYSPKNGSDAIRQALIFSRRLNALVSSTYGLPKEQEKQQ